MADDLVEDTRGARARRACHHGGPARCPRSARTRIERREPEASETYVRRVLAEAGRRGTIAYAASRLVAAAQEVRDNVPYDLARPRPLERTIAIETPASEQLQHQLFDVLESTLAAAGIVAESMVRDESWGYIEAGARLERAVPPSDCCGKRSAVHNLHHRRAARGSRCSSSVPASSPPPANALPAKVRRYLAQSAIALLLTDEHNPRPSPSPRPAGRCPWAVGDAELAAADSTLARALRPVDVVELASGDRAGGDRSPNNLTRELYAVSAALSASTLRVRPAHALPPPNGQPDDTDRRRL